MHESSRKDMDICKYALNMQQIILPTVVLSSFQSFMSKKLVPRPLPLSYHGWPAEEEVSFAVKKDYPK